jgi:hypothetical protein
MANDNIFQQYLTKPKSVLEYAAEMDQADARRQSLQQNALELAAGQQKMGDYQREREGENQLSRLLSAGGTPDQVAAGLAQAGYGKQALAYTKQQQELANSKATAGHLDAQSGKLKSETGKIDFEQRESKRQKAITDIAAFTDAQQAITSLKLHMAVGDIDPAQGQMIMQTIPQNPADFPKWQIGMLQRIMSAKDSAAQIAPDAGQVLAAKTQIDTNAATNATSRANNAATVRASMAHAGATREVAAATRDAATIRRDQETEMKLGDDYRNQSKMFKETSDAYRQIQATLDKATTSPAATLAGATKFMKLLDPGSVVRESELGMALAATGAFDRATNYVESLKYGKVLTQQQVNDFKGITAQIYKAAQVGQQQIDASYTKQAKAYKLRPEMIVQDLGQNAAAGGNDVLSAADAILKGGK